MRGPSAHDCGRVHLAAVLVAGVALRIAIYALPALQQTLASRPELVTAVSSFKRVQESAFLFEHVGSPYAGDVFHQPPLVFALFYPIFGFLPTKDLQYAASCALFILVDLLIACGFARLAKRTLCLEEGATPTFENKEIWLHQIPVSPLFTPVNLPAMSAFMYVWVYVRSRHGANSLRMFVCSYLFNPYSLASSGAMSTVSLTHVAVLYSLVYAAEGVCVLCFIPMHMNMATNMSKSCAADGCDENRSCWSVDAVRCSWHVPLAVPCCAIGSDLLSPAKCDICSGANA